ncbi:hypothetical protein [Bradyrhizobium sp. SZCCHNR1098]|uniref:hypothetical protein n=1 Tax=Bradyrhizobium sp. SZCCHNR1098 TaxID=3057370 RepID=UPI002916E66A|nr:hypothetical protein [Bradyrhizobium sp. SZCCHNR1098]
MTRRSDFSRLADRDRARLRGSESIGGRFSGPPVLLPEKAHQRPPQRDRAAMRQECDRAYQTWLTKRRLQHD